MNKIKIIPVLVFLISLPLFSQTIPEYDAVLQVNKNLPDYGFIIKQTMNESDGINYLIDVYRIDSNKLVQTIDLSKYYDIWIGEYPSIDSLIDVNFDGYGDICIITGIGENGKNTSYGIFFFNKDDGRFYQKAGVRDIYNIEVDDSLKQIYESYWTGCLDCITWNTYTFDEDKLVLIKRDYQDLDRKTNTLRRFVELYKDGKLISRKEMKPFDE